MGYSRYVLQRANRYESPHITRSQKRQHECADAKPSVTSRKLSRDDVLFRARAANAKLENREMKQAASHMVMTAAHDAQLEIREPDKLNL